MRHIAFIHRDVDTGYGVSFPDFPGCVAVGNTVDEALGEGSKSLSFHVEGLLRDALAIPLPRSLEEIRADDELAEWYDCAEIALVPLLLDKGSSKRVNISLDHGLHEAIDDEAKARGMTRSAFLASAARNEIEST